MESKRIFLAFRVEPAEEAASCMKKLQDVLASYRIRWVNAAQFHITLFFFGDVPLETIIPLRKLLHEALGDVPAFTFKLGSPGFFRHRKEPRVIWLGLESISKLQELKKKVDKAAEKYVFKSDNKEFRPHLTLGRFAPGQEVTQLLLDALNNSTLASDLEYQVNELILFESKLLPTGPQYRVLEIYELGTALDYTSNP